MKLAFSNLHTDGEIRTKWDVLTRIVGDFTMSVGHRQLYAEVDFCVVELAIALANWLATANDGGPDFVYTSMESETEGLVRFTLCERDAWRISSADQDREEPKQLTTEEVKQAALAYVNELRRVLMPRIDILDHIENEGARRAIQSWN